MHSGRRFFRPEFPKAESFGSASGRVRGMRAPGFENHLNVFHENKHGLPEALAYGLAAFLNTTAVDECFRRFNGHTQVNVTDLRLMKYPDRSTLAALGAWARSHEVITQSMMDNQLRKLAG